MDKTRDTKTVRLMSIKVLKSIKQWIIWYSIIVYSVENKFVIVNPSVGNNIQLRDFKQNFKTGNA